ncbi:MAG: 3-oxoacyl-ACP synthase III [Deltaproteobacteria bacterium]|jgi:3-oxoacyl-[acyl-carrier-protein] synthase-3|nr:3-oxoacyl-ACP synthase III [Deltaproteobacteria bacterium]
MRKEPKFTKSAVVAWARDEGLDSLPTSAIEEVLAPVSERLRIPPSALSQMTGINRRQMYPYEWAPSRAAVRAAERLFHKGFSPGLVDCLYSTSVGRDFLEPSTASVVQAALGLSGEVKSLDLGSACLGFIDGLELAGLRIEAGLSDYCLVVAGENNRILLENTLTTLFEPGITVKQFFDNFASLTLGSGGAAMVVGPAANHPAAPRLAGCVSLTDPGSNHLCRGDFSGMVTDSAGLLEGGVALAAKTFERGASEFGWTPDLFDLVVCHQVSETNTRRFAQATGLSDGRIFKTYPDYGNIGPVAVPFTFDLAWEKGLVTSGRTVGLMGIGSGLCCSMMELRVP